MLKEKTYSNNIVNEKITSLIDEIHERFTEEKCLILVGDTKEIPESLRELLNGSGVNGLACCNLDYNYLMYKRGKYDAYQFMCDIEKLFSELNREFKELVEFVAYGHIERKEVDHEGIKPVFDF